MSQASVTFEFTKDSLDRLKARLSKDQYSEALQLAADDLTRQGETAAKGATPSKGYGVTPATGHAWGQTVGDVSKGDHKVVGRYPYARWLDTGTDSRGREMKSRPGGYQIKAATMKAAKAAALQALQRAAHEVIGRGGR